MTSPHAVDQLIPHAHVQQWRDLNAGAQHFMVSDSAYEGLGQLVLGLPGEPMS